MRCGRPLPAKVPISRTKTHWDCLLDEMVLIKIYLEMDGY